MKKLVCFLALFCQLAPATSQTVLSGWLINKQSKVPIPYANIGIAHTEVGTIPQEDGSFTIGL